MKNKFFYLLLLLALLLFGLIFFFTKSSGTSEWLWHVSSGGKWLLPLITVSALVDSINPCAFSILIVSVVFLFGLGRSKEHVLKYGLVYIAGIFVAYFLIGLGILQALHIFGIPHFMSKVGALLLVLFGLLEITEVLFPKFPIKLGVPHSAHAKMNQLLSQVSIPAMFLLGALVGLCEFPCTGGPYLSALGLLHDQRTYFQGAGYLILYNVIFVLPLAIILFIASNKVLVEKVQSFHKTNRSLMKLIAGFLMILLAYLIIAL